MNASMICVCKALTALVYTMKLDQFLLLLASERNWSSLINYHGKLPGSS